MKMVKANTSTDRKILNILIPVILENALMTLSTMILTAYIGRLSVFEINAYGITRRIYGIYYSVFKGLSVGTMIAVAKRVGQGDTGRCARLQQESYFLFLPLSLLASFLIFFNSRLLLGTMTGDAGLLDTGAELIKDMVFFFPLLAMIHLNAAAFQANGNTRTPMLIAALGNMVNISLGYALIFGFRFIPALGIKGAVISQNFSFAVMALSGLFLLYGRKDFESMTGRSYDYVRGLNGHSEIALYVDTYEEVDTAFADAVSKGAVPVLEPTTEPWGQRTCYIADPEGNLIEIGSFNRPFEERVAAE